MTDEVVTHDEVLRWLPPYVQRGMREAERQRVLALSPEERGWWTEEEVAGLSGNWIAVTQLCSAEARYVPGRQ